MLVVPVIALCTIICAVGVVGVVDATELHIARLSRSFMYSCEADIHWDVFIPVNVNTTNPSPCIRTNYQNDQSIAERWDSPDGRVLTRRQFWGDPFCTGINTRPDQIPSSRSFPVESCIDGNTWDGVFRPYSASEYVELSFYLYPGMCGAFKNSTYYPIGECFRAANSDPFGFPGEFVFRRITYHPTTYAYIVTDYNNTTNTDGTAASTATACVPENIRSNYTYMNGCCNGGSGTRIGNDTHALWSGVRLGSGECREQNDPERNDFPKSNQPNAAPHTTAGYTLLLSVLVSALVAVVSLH